MYDGVTLAVQLSSLSPHHPRRAPLKIDQIAMVFRGFMAYLRDHPDRCRPAVAIKWPDRYLHSLPISFRRTVNTECHESQRVPALTSEGNRKTPQSKEKLS